VGPAHLSPQKGVAQNPPIRASRSDPENVHPRFSLLSKRLLLDEAYDVIATHVHLPHVLEDDER
jgi:hypothetical protein